MGDSRARWEGNTLVVDVIHFTDQTWLHRAGNFHSNALHVIERYTPADRDHILYEATIEDPKVFTRPWKMSMPLYRRQERNVQILEAAEVGLAVRHARGLNSFIFASRIALRTTSPLPLVAKLARERCLRTSELRFNSTGSHRAR